MVGSPTVETRLWYQCTKVRTSFGYTRGLPQRRFSAHAHGSPLNADVQVGTSLPWLPFVAPNCGIAACSPSDGCVKPLTVSPGEGTVGRNDRSNCVILGNKNAIRLARLRG